jgi:hypothetical protein
LDSVPKSKWKLLPETRIIPYLILLMSDRPKQIEININPDTTPVLYTENIYISSSEDGLTLDIAQKITGTNQLKVVARIGMSRTHAKKFLKELGNLLAITEGKVQTGKKSKN